MEGLRRWGLGVWLCLWPALAPAWPVFSEIMPDPAAVPDRRGEWFELFNPDGVGYALSGWVLADRDRDRHVIAGTLWLPPGGRLVFAREGDPGRNGGVSPDYVYGADLVLANGVDELVLMTPAGVVVDEVAWDGRFPFAPGVAMALREGALDNALPSAWEAAVTVYGAGDRGTPGSAATSLPVSAPAGLWWWGAVALLGAMLGRRGGLCGLIPSHDSSAAALHRPALHPRQAPQSLHFLHHPHFHAGDRRGGDGAHHRAVGD